MTNSFSAQCAIPGFGIEGQQKLSQARILAIGLGGLGSSALPALVAAGVGYLGIVDGDQVEHDNLHRQTLYRESDVGQLKAHAAAAYLWNMHPHLQLQVFAEYFTAGRATSLLADYDFILDLSDNYATHLLISDVARALNKPVVMAAVARFSGYVCSFIPSQSNACLRCFLGESVISAPQQTCQETGILGPVAALLGNLQAIELIKIISEVGEPLCDRVLWCDTLTMRFASYTLKRDPKCCSCQNPELWQKHPRPSFVTLPFDRASWELPARDFWNHYQASPNSWLIDVRTPAEHEHGNLGGTNVPLEELLKRLALQSSLSDHPHFVCHHNSIIFVYCQKGRRSAKAIVALQDAGYTAVSLLGGIEGK